MFTLTPEDLLLYLNYKKSIAQEQNDTELITNIDGLIKTISEVHLLMNLTPPTNSVN